MYPTPTRTLLLFLLFSSLVAAANFVQCMEDFRNDLNGTGGVDSRGRPTSPVKAVGLTYGACMARCESGSEGFSWREFTQLFALLLLPWLVLIGQLPFGSGSYTDGFISVVMSVGSPALAAYSLVLTTVNARLVYRRAQRIDDGGENAVARALIYLQQVPLKLTKEAHITALMSTSDQWRQEILDRLNRRDTWSVPTGWFIAWVAIVFVFTLVGSFVSLGGPADDASEGHAASTLWLWLLCLVIGWFWVPTFTCGELQSAIDSANGKIKEKATRRVTHQASMVYNPARTNGTGLLRQIPGQKGPRKAATSHAPEASGEYGVKGESSSKVPKQPIVNPVPEVDKEHEKVKIESIREGPKPTRQESEPEPNPPPIPGIHHQSTFSLQSLAASANSAASQNIVSVARSATTEHPIAQSSTDPPDKDRLFIPKEQTESLNHDEFRLGAMFNHSRIMGYLVLVDDALKALDNHNNGEHKVQSTGVFPPGALNSMFIASIFAVFLQCGTTAAAIIITVFTPTVGLGCRSLGYLLYGGIALLILLFTNISTLLTHISETRNEGPPTANSFTAFIAIALRKISFLLALVNATGLILLSCFQFSHFLDNCYCNASVIGRGTDSYILVSYEGWVPTMRNSRAAATVLAATSAGIYMIFLRRMSTPPTNVGFPSIYVTK